MRLFPVLSVSVLSLSLGWMAHAGMSIIEIGAVEFTQPAKADAKFGFEPTSGLDVTDKGLGWSGELKYGQDGGFITTPIALGTAWRPASGVSLGAKLRPVSQGERQGVTDGRFYVRYSPDKKHWSTWMPMQKEKDPKAAEAGWDFLIDLHVAKSESAAYHDLRLAYSKLDVPWKSDEEAAVRWILEKQPDFFAKQLPFIGYIQIRFEGSFAGGLRTTGFDYRLDWGAGGIHVPPEDPKAYEKSTGPWRFDATEGGKK